MNFHTAHLPSLGTTVYFAFPIHKNLKIFNGGWQWLP